MRHSILRTALAGALCAATAAGQVPSIAHVENVTLPSSATDQHGVPFTVSELSGICHVGGDSFLAVLDGSDKLVALEVAVDDDGAVLSAQIVGGLTLSESRDFEGIAFVPGAAPRVLLAEEGTPAVREFDLADGSLLGVFPTPAVYASVRPNRGFESLARACSGSAAWTANEEALTVDGPGATPSNGTLVRLLCYDLSGASPAPAEQLVYPVEAMHGPYLPGGSGQSGLSELALLPDGRLLALERSLALAAPPHLSRMYLVDPAGATDVSGLPSLTGGGFVPVSKTLVHSGGYTNLEGLCVGRELPGGRWSLLGVVDDGDPLSSNRLVAFVLSGTGPADCACATTSYCSTAPNSAGPGALVAASGSTSVAANDLVLEASGAVPGQFGLFYYGPLEIEAPFGDGFRCVGAGGVGLFRLGPPTQADGAGAAQRALDLTQPPANAGPGAIAAGSTWSFQYWYRDPGGPGGSGFNLSDGLTARFCR